MEDCMYDRDFWDEDIIEVFGEEFEGEEEEADDGWSPFTYESSDEEIDDEEEEVVHEKAGESKIAEISAKESPTDKEKGLDKPTDEKVVEKRDLLYERLCMLDNQRVIPDRFDPKEVVDLVYQIENDPQWAFGYHIHNSRVYAERLRTYLENHSDKWQESVAKKKALGIYYTCCRGYKTRKIALCDAIGFNTLFSKPLNTLDFLDAIHYAECDNEYTEVYSIGKKGRFFKAETIPKLLGVTIKELQIGINYLKRLNAKKLNDDRELRMRRTMELYAAGMTKGTDIAKQLQQEGIPRCSVRTIQNIIKSQGLKEG